jgi:WD40 repeat protein
LATASYDRTAKLWETKSGENLSILQGHEGYLNSITFSPDGMHVITASDDETIRLWDVETAQAITRFDRHTDWVCSASFNPKDAKQLVSGGNDAMVHVWDARSKKTIRTISEHRNNVNTSSFSPDGQEVLTASDDKTVGMWSVKSGSIRRRFNLPNEVHTAYFNNDGDQVLIATNSGKAYIVGAVEGDWIQTLNTRAKPTHSAVFSAHSQSIVTITHDYALLWSLLYNAHQKSKITLS